MKLSLIFLNLLILGFTFASGQTQAQDREYYQIRIYTFDNTQQQQTTDDYLKNAFIPVLKKMDIEPVGVFHARVDNSQKENKTFVLIPLKNLSVLETIEDQLPMDKTYIKNGKVYLEAPHDQPPYVRMESILIRAFENMPHMKPSSVKGPRADRVYELRSYESATEALHRNKVAMFNKGGEIKIFENLGFNAVFYGQVIAGCHMPNLMYMTTFQNQESRDEHWKAFRESPEWLALKNKPGYQNNVSHSDIYFLYPTEYSDF